MRFDIDRENHESGFPGFSLFGKVIGKFFLFVWIFSRFCVKNELSKQPKGLCSINQNGGISL